MSDQPTPQPGILDIAAYVPGRSGGPGQNAIKLSANESPLGASPRAVAAFAEVAQSLELYPEGSSRDLRETLAEVNGLDPARIVCGNGSGDLLNLLAQAYLGPGDEAIMCEHGFSLYPIVTLAAGATVVVARERDFTADVDAILAQVTEHTRMVFLANPNNPTGTYLSEDEVVRLHRALRPEILLVIDSAYGEYVTAVDYSLGAELVEHADNVVMVRTFSKMGLAAVRVGWLYGPPAVVDALNRIRGPFNVNLAGQRAAAEAARDTAFTARLCAHNAQWRDFLVAELDGNHLRVVPSQGNFVLVLFPDAVESQEAFDALMAAGLVVRQIGGYGIPQGLRISIGTEDAMRRVVSVLAPFRERT